MANLEAFANSLYELPLEYTICCPYLYQAIIFVLWLNSDNWLFFVKELVACLEFKKGSDFFFLKLSLGFFLGIPLLYFEFVVSYWEADFHWNCRVGWEWEHAVFRKVYRNIDQVFVIFSFEESAFCCVNHGFHQSRIMLTVRMYLRVLCFPWLKLTLYWQ